MFWDKIVLGSRLYNTRGYFLNKLAILWQIRPMQKKKAVNRKWSCQYHVCTYFLIIIYKLWTVLLLNFCNFLNLEQGHFDISNIKLVTLHNISKFYNPIQSTYLNIYTLLYSKSIWLTSQNQKGIAVYRYLYLVANSWAGSLSILMGMFGILPNTPMCWRFFIIIINIKQTLSWNDKLP